MRQIYGIIYSETKNGWIVVKSMIKDYYLCTDGQSEYWFETPRRAIIYRNKMDAYRKLGEYLQ